MRGSDKTQRATRGQRLQRWAAGTALLGAGAAGGGILASSMMANAATSSSDTSSSVAASTSAGASTNPDLSQSGTVTAVGASSVTIGTTTYAVDANSDIDKNGEASLSSLAVGDAVTFSTVTTNGTATIGKLHAGTESLNMPHGRPPDSSETPAPTA